MFVAPGVLGLPGIKYVIAMLVFLPVFILVQTLHWLGFLLDEILFPRYRRVAVREPVFIVGPPRSGTTFLHHTLARDAQFTTMRTWELCFGLSITARKVMTVAARLDRVAGRPLGRALALVERRAFRTFDAIHGVSLQAPEEDYLALTPIVACFLLVIPFPNCEALWRLSRFDAALSARDKRRILAFYTLCLQKHLYVYGEGKRVLSKNPSFTAWTGALRETFPDCRIICCMRDPAVAVPSMLNAIESGVRMFGVDRHRDVLHARMLAMMQHYYRHLLTELPRTPPDQHAFVTLDDLHQDLQDAVARTYAQLRLHSSAAFADQLARTARAARAHRSTCVYSLDRIGLDEDTIRARFGIYYRWRRAQTRPSSDARNDHPLRVAHQ
ncbi:MAG: sulfotransferase [Gammaproteobacteria bacterium]